MSTVKNLWHGYGGGDELVLALMSTVVFFIGLILVFLVFILRINVDKKIRLKLAASYVVFLLLTQVLAGIIWANLGGFGIMAVLISIASSPKLAYAFVIKKND